MLNKIVILLSCRFFYDLLRYAIVPIWCESEVCVFAAPVQKTAMGLKPKANGFKSESLGMWML